jgi:transcriptional regulator with XRE-family HTH domain
MEILTIGEKIKRARIYNGLTLKDISSDLISISKLSGIENDKIEPENDIIKYLSCRLDLSEEYIKQNISNQLLYNYGILVQNKEIADYGEDLKYNLNYSKEYGYYHIAFMFMHLLIEYYINSNKIETAGNYLVEYFQLFTKSDIDENKAIYYLDLGMYLYMLKEYRQALKYLTKVKNIVNYRENGSIYFKSYYYIIMSYFTLRRNSEFISSITELEGIISSEKNLKYGGEIYSLLAVHYYGKDKDKYELCKNKTLNANCSIDFGMIMMKFKSKEEGLLILNKAYELFNKENKKEFADFGVKLIKLYIDNGFYNKAELIIEETINSAIYLNNDHYIEKAYFYKALILGEKGDTDGMELYMNLSLDSLEKTGKISDFYNRYLLIGKMYYDNKKYRDSINYFNLSLKLKDKL